MKSRKPEQKTPTELRRRAEETLKTNITPPKEMSDKETGQLIHELQVHQIELEMQNEELRTSQSELEESRSKYSDLYDFAPVGYLTFDRNGLILEANLTVSKELGVERNGLVDKPFRAFIAAEDREIFDVHLQKVLKSDTRQTCEIQLKKKDGRVFYAQLESIAANDVKGNALCRTSAIDITERRKSEEKIKELNEELEQRVIDRTSQLDVSVRALQDFTHSVSHDLRAPLRHINSFAELLNENLSGSLDKKAQHYLNVISDSARQIGVLMDALLEFVRIGRAEMTKIKINPNQLVEEAISSLGTETKARDIIWNVHNLPEVYGDPAMLSMVFITLISNALKFTRTQPQARIEIGCTANKNEIAFSVRDNGVGFDMKYANKLFRVFQRLHLTKDFEGTGVGLANVMRIIQRHGGRTWAEGKVNGGATFYFTLPALQTID